MYLRGTLSINREEEATQEADTDSFYFEQQIP